MRLATPPGARMSNRSLHAEITIQATPTTILQAFQRIERWSTWYPGVVNAHWIKGERWLPNAIMQIQVKNSLGMQVTSQALVLPNIAQTGADQAQIGDKIVWENRSAGLVTVCHAWVESVAHGSRFTLQKFYRGPAVPLLQLLKGRQERMLQQALQNLQRQIMAEANE